MDNEKKRSPSGPYIPRFIWHELELLAKHSTPLHNNCRGYENFISRMVSINFLGPIEFSMFFTCASLQSYGKNTENFHGFHKYDAIHWDINLPLWCGIFIFCLLSFPQNKRKIYKLRQLRLSQFVNFLREVCLLFNGWIKKVPIFDIVVNLIIVSVCIFFSCFEGMRGDKN